MIRLTRPVVPPGHAIRSSQEIKKLWDIWRANHPMPKAKSSIYAHADVKKALRTAQHDKCAYCETLNPSSHEVVEHFRPKNGWQQKRDDTLRKPAYFWLSYEWKNLLFACDYCNDIAHKGNLFPLDDPSQRADATNPDIENEKPLLINPYDVNPIQHIKWNRDIPRPRNRSKIGSTCIQVFGLDQDGLLMDQRRQYFIEVENILALVETSSQENASRSPVVQQLLNLLKDSAPWAAMIRENFAERIRAL
jgi:uncharacterized protein (TIGR02646 family)